MRICLLAASLSLTLFLLGGCKRHSQSASAAAGKRMAVSAVAAGKEAAAPKTAPGTADTAWQVALPAQAIPLACCSPRTVSGVFGG